MKFLEAKDRNLADILSNNRFRIDSFQREYRWQRKQIEALISDLSICFEKNYSHGDSIENYSEYSSYYMGPIVLCDDNKELSIVDGQQRLTSFTLLLIFLFHAQEKLNLEDNFKKEIKQFLYVSKGGKRTLVLNVESRKKVIEHLLGDPEITYNEIDNIENEINLNQKNADESVQNIIERYEDITKLFPEELNNNIKLPLFIEWLLDKVILVEIKAFSMESAYTIFETMNDRGLSLNPTEILKGYLLSMIQEDDRSEEMNDFWRDRIFELKSKIGGDNDLDFFRNWLRAKYAETKRSNIKGAENLDFELIGTQFHSWVKNNSSRLHLKSSDDFYFFIKSDFNFYSDLYLKINLYKNKPSLDFDDLYVSNFYTIAESLSYPLFLSPISKSDSLETIDLKIKIINKFIDTYTVYRIIEGRAITQSSIRNYIYDLIRDTRNADVEELLSILRFELEKLVNNPFSPFTILHELDNWGFYHYFYSRIIHRFNDQIGDFEQLLRSRKQSSYVLHPLCTQDDFTDLFQDNFYYRRLNSVANFFLIRRYDIAEYNSLHWREKLTFLEQNNYLPEIRYFDSEDHIFNIIERRDSILRDLISEIWNLRLNFDY